MDSVSTTISQANVLPTQALKASIFKRICCMSVSTKREETAPAVEPPALLVDASSD
jgi:hypothetical protein